VIEPLWWSLSLGACLGGNGALTGVGAFGGRGHRRTQRHSFRVHALSCLRRALDAGLNRYLLGLRVAAIFLESDFEALRHAAFAPAVAPE